ncbi:AcrB/AcrD/AcrF family protein [Sphingomonas sp. M1-B02]|uniref:AcrB/AcrD/AcrF family protein n=1 Tax=Sphingomonas sp. M1-B02 TaxID=3114300 RepID=UPI00223EC3FF|nr:AcrB/AcrD/AcrF family protein [Sphingomonas sp. S6-11]UZK67956.1 AcrB/AcrD/AcrF family protein [Sphingomonas sp. S6-11]
MLVFWGCVVAWFLVQRQGNIHWLVLGDTDDNMRLMQVRALLAGQGWYDLRQYRLDPANGGFDIHWSRLVDLPIAGLILLLKPFLGIAAAERWACGIAPLLPLAITMTGLTLTIRRLVAPYAWPVAMIILMGCASTLQMYAPMRIDHHGWQLACLAMAVAGLADPKRARGGATVGVSSAVSLTIGLEMLPYCAMADAIIVLRWIWNRSDAPRLAAHGLTLAGGSALGFALFASNANQVMRCDALTPVWLSVMMATGSLLFALSLVRADSRWVRFALAAAAGAAIVAAFVFFFPQCLGRPEQVSDELANIWLNNVREAKPIYEHPRNTGFSLAVLPIIGILGALVATWRARRTEAAVAWAAIALFTTFAGAMLLWQVRAGPAAQMLSVPGATALVWLVVPWFLRRSSMLVRVLGSAAAFLLVSGLFAGLVLPYLPAEKAAKAGSNKSARANAACARITSLKPLNAIPASTFFTHVDMGPRLIVTTHHNAVAGPYHRNGQAILDVHKAFTGPAAAFRAIAAKHGANYLLVCPDMNETTVYRARSPKGFFGQLYRGQVPNWLEPVALPAKSPFRLWRIRYDLPEINAPTPPVRRPGLP